MDCVVFGCKTPAEKLVRLDTMKSVCMCPPHEAGWRTSIQRQFGECAALRDNRPLIALTFAFDRWLRAEELSTISPWEVHD